MQPKFSFDVINNCLAEWWKDNKHQRLGQYFINTVVRAKFPDHVDAELFYCENNKKTLDLIFNNYWEDL